MDERQVVTINTMHTCPMTTGNTPHVGGPIIGPGSTGVTINGVPIALQGDKCVCAAGGEDVILQGCPGVTINGVPIAVQGSPTAHGGTIPAGVPGVVIISKNTSVLEAGVEGEPAVYNLQWKKEDLIVQETKVEKVVTLVADTRNIADGEEVVIKVHTKEPDGGSTVVAELKGIVENNQVKVDWKVEEKEEPTQPSADCTVRFSLDTSKDNNFGFDSYEVSKNGCKDKEKLKSAYKKLEPFREEYLMPWVSLAQYRYAILKVAVKGKFKEITFKEPKSYFTFEPATITPKTEQVKITCNATITEKEYKVEVLADGKVAGGLMFVENSIKKLKFPVNWYNVVVNPTDLKEIKRLVSKQKIETYYKKAFTPALIEVEINEITTEIDISKLKNNSYSRIIRVVGSNISVQNIPSLIYLLHYAASRNPYQISLYTTYIQNENLEEDKHHNGFTWHSKDMVHSSQEAEKIFIDKVVTPTLPMSRAEIEKNIQVNDKEEVCIMFLANTNKQTEVEIPHELMHALGLEHTFEEKEHPNKELIFSKGSTQNYMDYNNTKKTTFKWQWDILRNSKYLKLLILTFSLFLSSCRVMSDKELQEISCVCNDTILQEDKKLPIPPPPRILNDSLDIYVERQPRNMYLKYIEYLKTNEQKMIYYDLEGNIKQSLFSVPDEFIGREFIFDEEGNIKEVINHDEGWKICAFQAMAIAKKYAGRNYHKEDPLWQLYRKEYKGKKVWIINYKNRRYKWVNLYIDKDNGGILKVKRR